MSYRMRFLNKLLALTSDGVFAVLMCILGGLLGWTIGQQQTWSAASSQAAAVEDTMCVMVLDYTPEASDTLNVVVARNGCLRVVTRAYANDSTKSPPLAHLTDSATTP